MTIQDGLHLAVKALKKVLDENFKAERIDAAIVTKESGVMKKLSQDEINKLLK
jgi:20S proteasome alpha/beta subunit